MQSSTPVCTNNHKVCADCIGGFDDRLKRSILRYDGSLFVVCDDIWPGSLIRVRFRLERRCVIAGGARGAGARQFDDVDFGTLEFCDLVSDTPNPAAFAGGMQGDQQVRGIHLHTDPCGRSRRGNRGAKF